MYHSRKSSNSCSLAKPGSTRAIATHWNPRSQAANHGYSHGSGIEITSKLDICHQWLLRRRLGEGGIPLGSPASHRATS
jgi:hypothetical protein